MSDVSIKEEVGYQAIQAVIDRQIETEVDWKSIKEIGLLGMDEISLKKGYWDYVTLIISRTLTELRILAVLKGREKVTIKAFLQDIPKKLRKTIVGVCMDMYDGFINAAKEVFGKQIPIIVDRFHAVQLYRKCLASLRKQELKRLRKNLSEEEYRALKPAIGVLCYNKEFMTAQEKETVALVLKQAPLLKIAYQFCCELTGIYNRSIDSVVAHEKITLCIQSVGGGERISLL